MSDPRTYHSARQSYEKAVSLHRQDKLADAERHYRAVQRDYPAHSGVLHGLGLICGRTDRPEEAVEFLERAAAAAQQDPAIRGDLGNAYLTLGRYEEARRCFEAVLASQPTHGAALQGLGNALGILGKPTEALAAFERLLAIGPKSAAAHFGIGTIQTQLGLFAPARDAFERAVALSPGYPAYHRALAETATFVEGDPRLAALEALSRKENTFPEAQKVELHFALAKAYDDLGRYERAFGHLKRGNTIKRHLIAYDETAVTDFFRQIAAAFTPALLQARRGAGHRTELPIFVVGMPRSGTSLVEQILASHPDVFGAGELLFVSDLVAEGHAGAGYPGDAASLSRDTLRTFGRLYTDRVQILAPQARRVVDKLPANFRHIGLIHLAMPGARIIHVRRDPADTCFSCYSKLFLNGLNYTYDLGELGRYHKAYEALMAHWRAVLPQGALLDVQYETLTGDLAGEARRIVAFCGLEWDARCLSFHETARPVRTLSQLQVRRPLFTTSIGRWRLYEAWLQPLLDALR
jgi:tetratricopeptide (TPR) repeat protein